MSGTSSSGGGSGAPPGGQAPAGIRPADPPAPRSDSLTLDEGLQDVKRLRGRAAKGAPAGRQAEAASAPAGTNEGAAGDGTGDAAAEARQQLAEAGGETGEHAGGGEAAAGDATGAEARFRVEGVGEVGIGELVQGYLRQADYTAKTQATAAAAQQMQQAHQALTQMRGQLEARLGQVATEMGSEFDTPVDWVKLAKEDPLGYQEKHARFTAYETVKREQQALAAQSAREEHAREMQVLHAANEYLGRALPGWKEPAKRDALLGEIRSYAKIRGYTDQELNEQKVLDPRQILVLDDAALGYKVRTRQVNLQPGKVNGGNGNGASPRGAAPAGNPARRVAELESQFEQDRHGSRGVKTGAALISALKHRPPGRR